MFETIKIPSGKSILEAVYVLPKQHNDKLAFMLPGYLDTKDYPHIKKFLLAVADVGYTAVSFDPPGTWNSGNDLGNYTMSSYIAGIGAALTEIEKLNGRPFHTVIVSGHSIGGLMGLIYSAANAGTVHAAIGIMCPPAQIISGDKKARFRKWKKEGFRLSERDLPNNPNKTRKFEVPYGFVDDANKYDLRREIHNFHNPLLMIAGEKDDLVSPEIVKQTYDKANEPKKFVILKDIDHDYRLKNEEIEIVNREIINFLRDNSLA